MFETTASVIPIQNSELSSESKSPGYNWKTLAKAGVVFVTTAGAFLALKATGSFSLVTDLFRRTSKD